MKRRELRSFKSETVGGVDMTSHPSRVAKSRATYMKNLISREDGIGKRRGVHQIYRFTDEKDAPLKINGIHSYLDSGTEKILIHAGCGFYLENGSRIPSSVEITDTPSSIFQLGGRIYIIGCGGLLLFDGERISAAEPYTPTLYSGFDSAMEADALLEGRNLMSPFGMAKYCGKRHREGELSVFRFPEDVSDENGVTVTVNISAVTNQLYICIGDSPDPEKDTKISSPVSAVFKLSRKGDWNGRTRDSETVEVDGGSFYILDSLSTQETFITPKMLISPSGRAFSFNFDTESECSDDMTITVEYTSKGWEMSPILGCTFGEIIQDSRGQSRLALSGNPACPNKIFFSDSIEQNGPLYFPEECVATVDSDDPITGFLKLSDTYLGVFKKNRFFRYAFTHRPDAEAPRERHIISGYESRDTVGCINPYVSGRQGADLLVFDGESVYGIDGISKETDRAFLEERSRNIKKPLSYHTKEELELSRACMHGGKYYLFIGDRVYIADTEKSFIEKELSANRQYEWWIWEGISVSSVGTVGGKMYMGDACGGISVIGDDFRDIRIHKAASLGDVLYSESEGLFTLNPSMVPEESFFVKIKGDCSFLEKGEFSAFMHTSLGKTRTVILPSVPSERAKEGVALRVILSNGEEILCHLTYFADDEDLHIFSLGSADGELLSIDPSTVNSIRIADNENTEYSLKRFDNKFATYDGEEAVSWYSAPLSFTVYTYSFVECIYISPFLDMGEEGPNKSLYKIGIKARADRDSDLVFGYMTDKNQTLLPVKSGGFDLSRLDLDRVSLSLPVGNACEKRVFERRFSTISFFFRSADASDCLVRGLSAVYTLNNKFNGVR